MNKKSKTMDEKTFKIWATGCAHVNADKKMGRDSLGEAITELAKSEGFTQILTSSGNEFAYIDEAFDITEKVMDKLGIKMPPPPKK